MQHSSGFGSVMGSLLSLISLAYTIVHTMSLLSAPGWTNVAFVLAMFALSMPFFSQGLRRKMGMTSISMQFLLRGLLQRATYVSEQKGVKIWVPDRG